MYQINISEHLGCELRSRTKAERLRRLIEERPSAETVVVLDFMDVAFMSRSFADEVYTITSTASDLQFQPVNVAKPISDMMEVVAQSRRSKRVRRVGDSTVRRARTMAELRKILAML